MLLKKYLEARMNRSKMPQADVPEEYCCNKRNECRWWWYYHFSGGNGNSVPPEREERPTAAALGTEQPCCWDGLATFMDGTATTSVSWLWRKLQAKLCRGTEKVDRHASQSGRTKRTSHRFRRNGESEPHSAGIWGVARMQLKVQVQTQGGYNRPDRASRSRKMANQSRTNPTRYMPYMIEAMTVNMRTACIQEREILFTKCLSGKQMAIKKKDQSLHARRWSKLDVCRLEVAMLALKCLNGRSSMVGSIVEEEVLNRTTARFVKRKTRLCI